jgi:hypothetical protein
MMRLEIKNVSPIQFCIVLLIVEVAIFFTGFVRGTHWASKRIYEVLDEATEEINKEQETLEILEGIIVAESNNKHNDIWGQDGEYGIVQFKQKTFYWLAEKVGMPHPDWKSQIQQIQLLNWAIRNGFGSQWTTYKNTEVEK